MAAQPLTEELKVVLPELGPLAIPIVGAIILAGSVLVVRRNIDRILGHTGNAKKQGYIDLRQDITTVMYQTKVQAWLLDEGYNPANLTASFTAAVAAELKKLNAPVNLPTFTAIQDAVDFWGENYNYYLQGLQTDEYFAAITAWCNAEITRLSLAAATTPPVTPGPVTVPGAIWQPGTILYAPMVQHYIIILSVALVNSVITYYYCNLNTRISSQQSQDKLLGAGFAAVISVPIADPAATNALIDALNTQIAALNLQIVALSQDLTNALAALASSARVVTVDAPDVTVQAGDITVQASPAPNVWVTPQLSTGALEASLSAMPLALSQTLVAALAVSAGAMSHSAGLGRLNCMPTSGAALLGQLGMPLAALSLPIMFSKIPMFRKAEEGAFSWLLDQWLDPIRKKGGISPAEGPGVAVAMLNATVAMGMSAHLAAIAGEAMTPLKHMGIGYLAGFLGELAGWGRIASGTVGTIEAIAISQPMRYYVNSLTRSALPDVSRALSLYAQRELEWRGDEQAPGAADVLGYHGLSNAWIDIYRDESYRHPALRELTRYLSTVSLDMASGMANPPDDVAAYLAGAGYPAGSGARGDWLYHLAILKAGYHPAYVDWLTEVSRRSPARAEKSALITAAQKMRRDGFITPAGMTAIVREAWDLTNPVTARVRVAELEADYKMLSDTRSIIVLSMAKGLITRDEARTQLTAIGLAPERVELEVLKGTLGMIPGMRLEISMPEAVLEEAGLEVE